MHRALRTVMVIVLTGLVMYLPCRIVSAQGAAKPLAVTANPAAPLRSGLPQTTITTTNQITEPASITATVAVTTPATPITTSSGITAAGLITPTGPVTATPMMTEPVTVTSTAPITVTPVITKSELVTVTAPVTATPEVTQTGTTAPSSSTNAAAGFEYVVQVGDSLTLLAQRYGITLRELATANGLPINSYLYIGQRLHIPAELTPVVCAETYVVQRGDNLTMIGRRYGLGYGRLAAVNNLINPNLIRVGQQLCIPPATAP